MGLTLRKGNREFFYKKLDRHFPGLKQKYIKLYGENYSVMSTHNASLMNLFFKLCKENGIEHNPDKIFSYLNKFEDKQQAQLEFF